MQIRASFAAGVFACASVGPIFGAMPAAAQAAPAAVPHNVIIFVPDGLRSAMVDAQTAPAMDDLRKKGVYFSNSHALFPTFTTANASAIATGHYLGDTGDFSNTVYAAFPILDGRRTALPSGGIDESTMTPFLENDVILGGMNAKYKDNYLNEESVLDAAARAGYSTAAVGKIGPVAIQDVTARTGDGTIVIDDATGSDVGLPLNAAIAKRLAKTGADLVAPTRGANGNAGAWNAPGTLVPNIGQQQFFVDATVKAVLPEFKARNKPFVMVFWSRDPDGTQHNQGDSLGQLVPGIDGPTSLAAIRNADNDLAAIEAAVQRLGLAGTTDIVVTADHGFSTIAKQSMTSTAAANGYRGYPGNDLPSGFLAIDVAKTLGMPLLDPDREGGSLVVEYENGETTARGNGTIGTTASSPSAVVAANGGSDLVYFPGPDAKAAAAKVIPMLLAQDYVSGIFVDAKLGTFPGTLPLAAINLDGAAITPVPGIVVNFRSFATGCAEPLRCTAEIADTNLMTGQGMHGSFSRADTFNFQAAIGPDFKTGYVDAVPTSNADIGMTVASILGLHIAPKGSLTGRVIAEAQPNGAEPAHKAGTLAAQPDANGLATTVKYQDVGTVRYFDAAGFAGRTVGL
jgi:hypothetical protein